MCIRDRFRGGDRPPTGDGVLPTGTSSPRSHHREAMRRPALLIPLLATLACGPSAAQRAQPTLAPLAEADSAAGPVVACMDAVLAGSPLIERIRTSPRNDLPRSRGAEL